MLGRVVAEPAKGFSAAVYVGADFQRADDQRIEGRQVPRLRQGKSHRQHHSLSAAVRFPIRVGRDRCRLLRLLRTDSVIVSR